MGPKRPIELRAPLGGISKRVSYVRQSQYTTPDAKNVRPDGAILGRERLGSRPGLEKAFAQQISGSANPIRMMSDVRYIVSGAVTTQLVAVANGALWRETVADTTMAALSTSLSLDSTNLLHADDRGQKLYIADYGAIAEEASDGVLSGTNGLTFSSATVSDFSAGDSDANDYVLWIDSVGNGVNAVQTITIDATGGTYAVTFGASVTGAIAEGGTAAALEDALEILPNIGPGNVSVTGSSGGPYTVTFTGDLSSTNVALMTADGANLTGGASTSVVTLATAGAAGPVTTGSYEITTVGTNLTLTTSPYAAAGANGIEFRVERCPKIYDPVADTLVRWRAKTQVSATVSIKMGSVPAGCPLIAHWRDRLVLAGALKYPHQWYMSRQGDPLDWRYGDEDFGSAVSGANADAGQVGEPITALIPHSDDCLIFGCSTSLWTMRGDPTVGTSNLDQLSREFGIISKAAWCYDATGYLWFLSRDGIYRMQPGCGSTPLSISREMMPEELLNINPATVTVTMAYDVRHRGIHVYLVDSSGPDTHWWIDTALTSGNKPAAAFWPVAFATEDHEPFSLFARRNYSSAESWVYLGGRDGYIRRFDDTVEQDDGANAIASYCYIGPFPASPTTVESVLVELQADRAKNSGNITWSIYEGSTPEEAFLNSTARETGTWDADHQSLSEHPRVRGNSFFLKVSNAASNSEWAIESIIAYVRSTGKSTR